LGVVTDPERQMSSSAFTSVPGLEFKSSSDITGLTREEVGKLFYLTSQYLPNRGVFSAKQSTTEQVSAKQRTSGQVTPAILLEFVTHLKSPRIPNILHVSGCMQTVYFVLSRRLNTTTSLVERWQTRTGSKSKMRFAIN
jgi:hypothetical protein